MRYSGVFILVLFIFLAPTHWLEAAAEEGSTGVAGVEINGGAGSESSQAIEGEYFEDEGFDEQEVIQVSDPLEPVNRVFFHFNDKLYFWLLKPLGQTYGFLVPKSVRSCVANFFYNLETPIRLANNVLQGKVMDGGIEMTRFMVNTTVGIGGLWDPARNWFGLAASEEDFGQTLGKYGVGEGIYICWPVLGPSNIRDTFGAGGDYFLNPVSYLGFNGEGDEALAVNSGKMINKTSLSIGDYEDFKAASFDPYSALRDAYSQRRRNQIKDSVN